MALFLQCHLNVKHLEHFSLYKIKSEIAHILPIKLVIKSGGKIYEPNKYLQDNHLYRIYEKKYFEENQTTMPNFRWYIYPFSTEDFNFRHRQI